jgi:hypothetical protein
MISTQENKNQNKIHIIMAPPDKQAAAMMMLLLLYITVILSVQAKNLTSRRREDFQLHQHTQNPSVFNSFAAINSSTLGVRKSPLCFYWIWSTKGGACLQAANLCPSSKQKNPLPATTRSGT